MLPTSDSTCLMFTLEAVVGAGKSTTLHSMKESLPQALGADQVHEVQGHGFSYMQLPQGLTLVFIPEAVEDWIAAGCLQAFYSGDLDPKPFQLLTLFSVTTRLAAAAAATSHCAFRVFIQERSLGSNDEVFAASLKAADVEFGKAYDCCVKLSRELLPQALLSSLPYRVYLHVSPAVAAKRAAGRARAGEEGLKVDLLRTLEESHHKWLKDQAAVVTIDASLGANVVATDVQRGERKVRHLVFTRVAPQNCLGERLHLVDQCRKRLGDRRLLGLLELRGGGEGGGEGESTREHVRRARRE